ncbi:MAG: hypothetical protein IZT55_03710 [Anaerolineae bacterium]|nr:hypothetical protein [Anaerolineae bacterium]
MRPDSPRNTLWWIAVAIGILGIVGYFTAIPFVSEFAFWFVVIGFALIAISSS